MDNSMMKIAMPFVQPPVCKVCGGRMRFELGAASKLDYTGGVRVVCSCGDSGKMHRYALYGTSIPELWDVLRGVAADYKGGGNNDG